MSNEELKKELVDGDADTVAEEPKAKPTPRRTRTTAKTTAEKPAAKPATAKPNPRKTAVPKTDEPVVLKDGDAGGFDEPVKPDTVNIGVSNIVAEAVEADFKDREEVGSENYETDNAVDSHIYKLQDGEEAPNTPQLPVYARNAYSLMSLLGLAYARVESGNQTQQDMALIDLANQNDVMVSDHDLVNFFSREGAKWNNGLRDGDRIFRNSRVSYRGTTKSNVSVNRLLTGISRRMGTGDPILCRLWHSGLIIQINPQTVAEGISMVAELEDAHLDVLRRTVGLVHGTNRYYANRIIAQYIMRSITDANVDPSDYDKAYELIDHRDIQLMANAIMASRHVRGYNLTEICGAVIDQKDSDGKPMFNADGKRIKTVCNEIKRELVDFNFLVQVDQLMFTEKQRKHMIRNCTTKVSIEEIIEYQKQGRIHEVDYVEATEDGSVMFIVKAPKINRHIEIGEEWVATAEAAVERAISINADEETRTALINEQLEATSFKDLMHWVVGVVEDGVEYRIGEETTDEGLDVVDVVLDDISKRMRNNPEMEERLSAKIRKAMISRLGAVVAVPTTKCKCGTLSNHGKSNGSLIYTPIDMVSRFFTQTVLNQ